MVNVRSVLPFRTSSSLLLDKLFVHSLIDYCQIKHPFLLLLLSLFTPSVPLYKQTPRLYPHNHEGQSEIVSSIPIEEPARIASDTVRLGNTLFGRVYDWDIFGRYFDP